MKILTLILNSMRTNCYILINEQTNEAIVVDPADNAKNIYKKLNDKKLKCKYIILTHAHFDHMLGLEELRELTGAPFCIHENDAPSLKYPERTLMIHAKLKDNTIKDPEIVLKDNDILKCGDEQVQIIHTPGHTMGSICIICGNNMISGDTLFRDGIGRYDLYGSDYKQLLNSLHRISQLQENYKIYPGHGSTTTLNHEKELNIYVK